MKEYSLLGYDIMVLETVQDCADVKSALPGRLSIVAFDTETDTKIDMSKRDANNIDIMHDKPFLLQFGFNNKVYEIDFRKGDDLRNAGLDLFDSVYKRAVIAFAHNVNFDIHMLLNVGFKWEYRNLCDSMAVARLGLEARSEREGGYPMALKPLSARLLGSTYSEAGKALNEALGEVWKAHLKRLFNMLKPYGIKRSQIDATLKDVTGTLDEYSEEVQQIWNLWSIESRVTYQDVPTEVLYPYGAVDIIDVLEIAKLLLPVVKDRNQMKVLKKGMELIPALVKMERTGFEVDKTYLIRSKQALIFEINSIKEINYRIAGKKITPNQHQAIKEMIESKFGYVLESTDKNMLRITISSDDTLHKDAKEYLENVIYLRTLEKWVTTYINPMLYKLNTTGDTKVYTMYNPNGAVSGRFTSNFQQFPKSGIRSKLGDFELFHPRKMFVTSKEFKKIAYIDYSQIELRVQAHYTNICTGGYGDINMMRAYTPFRCVKNSKGEYVHEEDGTPWHGIDLHTQATAQAFPDLAIDDPHFKKLRGVGKRVNFMLIYGASLRAVKEALADTDPSVVETLYSGFYNRFKDVITYGHWVGENWLKNDSYVENLFGRRYYISESRNVYKLNNYLIQGSSADLIKEAILRVHNFIEDNNYKSRLQGTIHDENILCVADGEDFVIDEVKKIMENIIELKVPIIAEVETTTTNWAEKKGA